MNSHFDIAAGSVPGMRHIAAGRNNQDALCVLTRPAATVAIVCDGCGSAARSEVGAWLGAELIAGEIIRRCDGQSRISESSLVEAGEAVVETLRTLAGRFVGREAYAASEGFLFTVIGVVVLAEETVVFAAGDGVFAVNGEVVVIGPFAGNAPPYLGLSLLGKKGGVAGDGLKVLRRIPTTDVESVAVGSDGIGDLLDVRRGNEKGEPFARFWKDDVFFRNPDAVRRRLAHLNQPVREIDWDARRVRKTGAVLDDDTTLVVIRRKRDALTN